MTPMDRLIAENKRMQAQVETQADTIETLCRKNAALEAENMRQAARLKGGPDLPASGAKIGRNGQGKG